MERRVSIIIVYFPSSLTNCSDTHILQSESDQRGIYILAGRPRDDRYLDEVIEPIAKQMREMRNKMKFSPSSFEHRRGKYSSVSIGFSLGPGSTVREFF